MIDPISALSIAASGLYLAPRPCWLLAEMRQAETLSKFAGAVSDVNYAR